MPEFEEIKPNPDLHKEINQYQPSKMPSAQQDQSSPQSNMRSRWKRPAKPSSKPFKKTPDETHRPHRPSLIKEPFTPKQEEIFLDDEPYIEDEIIVEKKEHLIKAHSKKPREEKIIKPTRKDVFIPKTREDSNRHKTRYPSMASKKPSLWRKILAFLGLAAPIKKRSNYRPSRSSKYSSHDERRPQRKRSGQSQQKHRSGPPRKRDQKFND